MPELIRLQTPYFEFSVWANDISQRLSVYQNTMTHRANANDVHPSYELRFAPAVQLNNAIEPQGLVADDLVQSGLDESDLAENDFVANGLGKHAELTLNSPLFFENTQYQFEWVFFSEVTNARLTHRSQSVSEAFRFAPEVKTARGVVPARLTGTINTGNDVGWLRLPLTFEHNGKTQTQHIAFEVLPTKMALQQDLPAMYQAIDKVYPLWRFSLVEKTEQDAATSQQRGNFPLMWLANFSALRKRFEQGLKVICAAPHSRLQPTAANIKAAKLKGRLPHKLAEQVKQDFANGQYDKRYAVEKKQLSIDTPENRFIKMAVSKSKRQLTEFEQKLRQSNQAPERQRLSDSFLNELHSWQQPLQEVLGQGFLQEVGAYKGLNRESLVLQQKTGYSAVYRVWQELKFYLDVFENQSSISMKSVAEIYEVWCFLCLKQILEQDLGFDLVENSATKLAQNDFFEYQLKDGFAGAFRFKRSDGVTARLAHEPKFGKNGKTICSHLVTQEPDIILEVTLPDETNSVKGKEFIWLFDAKYRIKTKKSRFDNSDDINGIDYVPDDALNQMHRYRDALIKQEKINIENRTVYKKSRPIFGAFILYPGFFDQLKRENPYQFSIEQIGIGAFPLLPKSDKKTNLDPITIPKSDNSLWLRNYLARHINQYNSYNKANTSQKLLIEEPVRITHNYIKPKLYNDLTLVTCLGDKHLRMPSYFECFENQKLKYYHIPCRILDSKSELHIIEELRYLFLIPNHKEDCKLKYLWPIKSYTIVERKLIPEKNTGKKSQSNEMYYLFELDSPLELIQYKKFIANPSFQNTLKITTLKSINEMQEVSKFAGTYLEDSKT